MRQWHLDIKTPIGILYLVASERGLKGIGVNKPKDFYSAQPPRGAVQIILRNAQTQLDEYFEGKRASFEIPLDAEGTEFQKKVWRRLSQIPYGQTKSYKDIAIELQAPKACRAVGSANGKNPLMIVIPCHRVIASDGTLGGYSGGLDLKIKLLELEQNAAGTFL